MLIVGTGPRAAHVRRVIERNPEWGLRMVGYVDEETLPVARDHPRAPGPQARRGARRSCGSEVIDEVIVAMPALDARRPSARWSSECAAAGVPITLLTDLFGDYLPPPRVSRASTR